MPSVKTQLYRDVSVKAGDIDQMAQFIMQSSTKSYQGELRRQLQQHGYGRRKVVVDDPEALQNLSSNARTYAKAIRNTYNQYLKRAIDKLPDGTSRKEALQALDPFIARTRAYNTSTLFPLIAADNHELARYHFMQRNGIKCKWRVVGPTPPADDVCARDLARGPIEDFNGFESKRGYPAHPHCPHRREAVQIASASMPDRASVWYGQKP